MLQYTILYYYILLYTIVSLQTEMQTLADEVYKDNCLDSTLKLIDFGFAKEFSEDLRCIYIYICIYIYMCVYVYVCIYIYRERPP